MEKTFPNGTTTGYAYTETGRLEKICHAGAGFEEEYSYRYDMAGNKTGARKQRRGQTRTAGTSATAMMP